VWDRKGRDVSYDAPVVKAHQSGGVCWYRLVFWESVGNRWSGSHMSLFLWVDQRLEIPKRTDFYFLVDSRPRTTVQMVDWQESCPSGRKEEIFVTDRPEGKVTVSVITESSFARARNHTWFMSYISYSLSPASCVWNAGRVRDGRLYRRDTQRLIPHSIEPPHGSIRRCGSESILYGHPQHQSWSVVKDDHNSGIMKIPEQETEM
jgi:hypothetical protein